MWKRAFPILLGLLVVAATGCGDDGDTPSGPQADVFTASLSGANEVPSVQTIALGVATFIAEGAIVLYTIEVEDIQEATEAHIHDGAAGVNGPVLVELYAAAGPDEGFTGTGVLVTGSFEADDIVPGTGVTLEQLVDRLDDASLYVNVHTAANPDGEIRGQIE